MVACSEVHGGRMQAAASSSSRQTDSSQELPDFLADLEDASKPGQLPPPCPGRFELANKQLDRLVRGIAAQPAIWKRCLDLSQWLQGSGHTVDARLVTTLMSACTDNGQPLQAVQLYQSLLRRLRQQQKQSGARSAPSAHVYTEAMRAALEAGAISAALDVWKDAQRAGAQRDSYLTCTYMRVLLRVRRFAQAVQLWTGLENTHGARVPMQAHVLAMRAMTESGAPDRALTLYARLHAQHNGALPGALQPAALGSHALCSSFCAWVTTWLLQTAGQDRCAASLL
jgi:hypothetical protein